jgi:D-alanine-D-alanine ligase
MKPVTLAFLYNVRHTYPDPQNSLAQLETDFDDPETVEAMVKHLRTLAPRVIPIEADKTAYLKLYKQRHKIDLVFNYAEGLHGEDREAQLPAMLEMLQLPYTGSGPLVQMLALNKAKAKEILMAHRIPTLPFQLMAAATEPLADHLTFPLIVKPVAQGSSAGITNQSVVRNAAQLKRQVKFVTTTFKQPALIEPFLTGREFSVAMLGNPPQILPIIESDHTKLPKGYQPLDSLEVKWLFEEEAGADNLICPARLEPKLKTRIETICRQTWKALGVRDLCRIDVRCDADGQPFILEMNSPVGLIPPEISLTSYFPLSARTAGIAYPQLLKTIIAIAWKRSH